MSSAKVASRYASALLEESIRMNILEEINQDVEFLADTISGNRDLLLMLRSPIVNSSLKQNALKAIFGDKVNALTMNFLDLLVRKRREAVATDILSAFTEVYNAFKNIKAVELVTATPIGSEEEAKIIQSITSQLGGASLDVKKSIDPGLLGGFVIKIGDKVFDTSIRNKLSALKRSVVTG